MLTHVSVWVRHISRARELHVQVATVLVQLQDTSASWGSGRQEGTDPCSLNSPNKSRCSIIVCPVFSYSQRSLPTPSCPRDLCIIGRGGRCHKWLSRNYPHFLTLLRFSVCLAFICLFVLFLPKTKNLRAVLHWSCWASSPLGQLKWSSLFEGYTKW